MVVIPVLAFAEASLVESISLRMQSPSEQRLQEIRTYRRLHARCHAPERAAIRQAQPCDRQTTTHVSHIFIPANMEKCHKNFHFENYSECEALMRDRELFYAIRDKLRDNNLDAELTDEPVFAPTAGKISTMLLFQTLLGSTRI